MTRPARFTYTSGASTRGPASLLAYLPITLGNAPQSVGVAGLLDSGSTVNVLPYIVGVQLGLVWEEQTVPVYLTGSLARLPARGVIITGQVESFPTVDLAFAWTQADEVPVILGQINFFQVFDVCFFRSSLEFEVTPRFPSDR